MNGLCDACGKQCDQTTGGISVRQHHRDRRHKATPLATVCDMDCLNDWMMREYAKPPKEHVPT